MLLDGLWDFVILTEDCGAHRPTMYGVSESALLIRNHECCHLSERVCALSLLSVVYQVML